MGSLPPMLPMVSLKSPTIAEDIGKACREVGFFYLTDHGLSDTLMKAMLEVSQRFFMHTPKAEKEKIQRKSVEDGGDGARGYQLLNENMTKGLRDYHEAIDFYREWDKDLPDRQINGVNESMALMDGVPLHGFLRGPNLFPSSPPGVKILIEEYIERCQIVGTKIVKAMGEALGEGDVFVNATRNSFWVMRMIGYPPLANDDPENSGISCGEHTDYGCVTLLLTDETTGALQVQSRDGTWIDADPIPDALVINIGDMMETWTNGEWKSTNHRVIHRSGSYRVSVPFFFEPDYDALVAPLQSCVARTGGVAKYPTIVYGKHLMAKVEEGSFDVVG